MKVLLSVTLFMIIFLLGCQENEIHNRSVDSLNSVERKKTDDFVKSYHAVDAENTLYKQSNETSPIKIIDCYLAKGRFNQNQVKIKLRNNSLKTVDGIKIHWRLFNNFDEEIDQVDEGGIVQKELNRATVKTYSWDVYSTGATKVKAFVYSVHFKDGLTWDIEPGLSKLTLEK